MPGSFESRISALLMDVGKRRQIEKASIELQNKFGADLNLYCIVNNAGIFPEIDTVQRNLDIATNTIKTNFSGLANVTKYFGPLLDSSSESRMDEEKRKIIMNEDT